MRAGAPGSEHVDLVEDRDFGVMIAEDAFSSSDFQGLQSVTMHEVGHALGAGWADDKPVPIVGFACQKCFEVYSGNQDPDLTAGVDETPEGIVIGRDQVVRWSVMQAGTANNFGRYSNPRFAFSIEEVATIDFRKIPSKER